MQMLQNIGFQPGTTDPQNQDQEHKNLRAYRCNGGTCNFKPGKRSYAQNQQWIQKHISGKADEVGQQRSS